MTLYRASRAAKDDGGDDGDDWAKKTRCTANGCGLRATVAIGGGPNLCSYHARIDPVGWPRMTDALLRYRNIVQAVDEVGRIGDIDWCGYGDHPGKWRMLEQYFADDQELRPDEGERKHKAWYEYRLRAWILYLGGASGKRPTARVGRAHE